jgi:hypothetical protein
MRLKVIQTCLKSQNYVLVPNDVVLPPYLWKNKIREAARGSLEFGANRGLESPLPPSLKGELEKGGFCADKHYVKNSLW